MKYSYHKVKAELAALYHRHAYYYEKDENHMLGSEVSLHRAKLDRICRKIRKLEQIKEALQESYNEGVGDEKNRTKFTMDEIAKQPPPAGIMLKAFQAAFELTRDGFNGEWTDDCTTIFWEWYNATYTPRK